MVQIGYGQGSSGSEDDGRRPLREGQGRLHPALETLSPLCRIDEKQQTHTDLVAVYATVTLCRVSEIAPGTCKFKLDLTRVLVAGTRMRA